MSAVLASRVQLPDPWVAHAIDPYRACARCKCSQPGPEALRLCTHTDVTWHGKPVSVDRARARGGACGPEADLAVGLW